MTKKGVELKFDMLMAIQAYAIEWSATVEGDVASRMAVESAFLTLISNIDPVLKINALMSLRETGQNIFSGGK